MGSLSDLLAVTEGIVCIDGPAGAGKTTLAASLAAPRPARRTTVIHTDEMLGGWGGLLSLHEVVTPLVRELASGREGHYRRYDWQAGAFAEDVAVSPGGLVVIEGVGSWNPSLEGLIDLLVWVDAPVAVRHERAVARGDFGDHWDQWAALEEAHFAQARTRDRADLVLDLLDY